MKTPDINSQPIYVHDSSTNDPNFSSYSYSRKDSDGNYLPRNLSSIPGIANGRFSP